MRATSALQAATEFGGFDLAQADGMSADDVRDYFDSANMYRMFGQCSDCGGYTFEQCAMAVIDALEL